MAIVSELRMPVRVFGRGHKGDIPDGIYAVKTFCLRIAVGFDPVAPDHTRPGYPIQFVGDDAGRPDHIPRR